MPDSGNEGWHAAQFMESTVTIDPGVRRVAETGGAGAVASWTAPTGGDEPPRDEHTFGMTLVDHITELRNRILISVGVLFLAICGGWYLAAPVIDIFKALAPEHTVFTQITMGEVLMTTLQMSVYIGFAIAAPVILYNLIRFVEPGLSKRERSMVIWSVVGGTLLFLIGLAFAYFYVVGPAIFWLIDFGSAVAQPYLSIKEFVSFCSALLFVTGLMFELPMVLFLLSFTGLITSAMLIKEWRWATIIIFIVAAIVTPTQDPFSMSLVGGAMVLLYLLSIIPIKLCGR